MKLKSLFNILSLFVLLCVTNCKSDDGIVVRQDLIDQENGDDDGNTNKAGKPLFEFSIDGTDIDYITSTDPDTFLSIEYLGQFEREVPGVEPLLDANAYVFEATFTDNKKIGIWCRSNFGSLERATEYANKLTDKLGKLPIFMRDELSHVAVFSGESRASAEPDGKFFLISDERIDDRLSTNQLEETVFHEATHVFFEPRFATTTAWRNAQEADGVFITEFAEDIPLQEDIPETAIFVYTMENYPGRLSSEIETWVNTNVPNRYAFLKAIFDEND